MSAAQYFEVEARSSRSSPTGGTSPTFRPSCPTWRRSRLPAPRPATGRSRARSAGRSNGTPRSPRTSPNQRIAWRSVGDADVANAGAVRFDDRGGTTNIEVSLEYNPPGGMADELVIELVKDPDKKVRRAVDGFRQVVEAGRLTG